MLVDLTSEQATTLPAGFPYSIADQVGHMLFWQKRWLGRINEEPLERKKGKNGDWPRIAESEWDGVRGAFLDGLQSASELSENAESLNRRLWNGDTVDEVLLMIVIHNSYHLGQIALIRQLLGIWPPQGGADSW